MRSAHLERDFRDPAALSGYVVTDFARSCLTRVANGLKPHSGSRAWRMTGDYGCGKSSFALLLAHLFAGDGHSLPRDVKNAIAASQIGSHRPHLLPVLVTCSRQPLSTSILTSLRDALGGIQGRSKSRLVQEIQTILDSRREPEDDQVFRLLRETNECSVSGSSSNGLLLILDELGKFLEYAALYPERQDVYFLQRLAEAASRSGEHPFFVISLLHQGFSAYTDHLNQSAQREWEKVAGRYEEIVFNQPIEQAANIISAALNVRVHEIDRSRIGEIRQAMQEALDLGWLGAAASLSMVDTAVGLYPLHPTVLPVLIRTFRRFGQNERSLFSFLLSNEPFGLQAFAAQDARNAGLYQLHHFYDYVRTNFGHRLAVQSYRSHWNLISSVVESFVEQNNAQLRVLKTVGILNLLNDSDLLASEKSVICALSGGSDVQQKDSRAALSVLHKEKRIIYDRGRARGLCLWPHTSVDLEKAYEDACKVIDTPRHVADLITDFLGSRPLVARRHYVETGNLRHWEVRYCAVNDLANLLKEQSTDADGTIVVPLCETLSDREAALRFAASADSGPQKPLLIAVPQPLNNLASLVQEVQRWEWVSGNTLELNADKYAREEVSRQKSAARAQLERRIQNYVGWQQFSGTMLLEWFYAGRLLKIKTGRQLLEKLSEIFDKIYLSAPRVHNELVNRRALSSAAAAARMRLIVRMFNTPTSPLLGMDPEKKPPEMSIYLSVLKTAGLHRQSGDSWRIAEPRSDRDRCNVLPALRQIHELVRRVPDTRVNIGELFDELRKPPYGVRDGLMPILLAVFAIAHDRDVAFYKDGSFLRELDAEQVLLLTKAPGRFEIQYCKIEGVRSELFDRLVAVLEIRRREDREMELLDVVRGICQFVAQVPPYSRNTKRLSPSAIAVRQTVLNAREPVRLIFTDLPVACGFTPIDSKADQPVQSYVKTLKLALDELRMSYPELQDRLRKKLRQAFGLAGSFPACRAKLAERSEDTVQTVTEPKFRAFCLRLMDEALPEAEWLESIGSHLALKPPSRWSDGDEDIFNSELAEMAARFHRLESMAFGVFKKGGDGSAVRLAVTLPEGYEHEQVIHYSAEEEKQMVELQTKFADLLAQHERLGLAAVSRAIWARLSPARGKA